MPTCYPVSTSQENRNAIKFIDLIKYSYFLIIFAVAAKPWDEGSVIFETRKLRVDSMADLPSLNVIWGALGIGHPPDETRRIFRTALQT